MWDIALSTMMDNLITNLKAVKPSTMGFDMPEVGDSILLALKDGSSDIVEVMMIADSWMSVDVDDIESPDYGNCYVVQFRDIDYIVNFGDDTEVMSDEELTKALNNSAMGFDN